MIKYEDVHFVDNTKAVWNYSLFTVEDVRNFQDGTHYSLCVHLPALADIVLR